MKKKRKRTCHVANTSKEPTSPLEVAWWGSKYHEALLWALRTGRRRRRRRRRWWKRGPSSFSHICILTNHTHTHTHTHTPGLFYRSPPVQCSCRGASVYPKPHSQTSTSSSTFSSPVSPCSSRSRSHSLHRGRRDYRWVKFTSLRKLFDITNKVKVYQKTPEDYIIMVCWVARCTSRSKK